MAQKPPPEPESDAYPTPTPQVAYVLKPRPRWQALRTIASVVKVLAWVSAGWGVLAILVVGGAGSPFGNLGVMGNVLVAGATAIVAGSVFLGLYGYAEVMLVLVAIEANTRKL